MSQISIKNFNHGQIVLKAAELWQQLADFQEGMQKEGVLTEDDRSELNRARNFLALIAPRFKKRTKKAKH